MADPLDTAALAAQIRERFRFTDLGPDHRRDLYALCDALDAEVAAHRSTAAALAAAEAGRDRYFAERNQWANTADGRGHALDAAEARLREVEAERDHWKQYAADRQTRGDSMAADSNLLRARLAAVEALVRNAEGTRRALIDRAEFYAAARGEGDR